jgi:hypothetical protein
VWMIASMVLMIYAMFWNRSLSEIAFKFVNPDF